MESISVTGVPILAKFIAMPPPIVPAPMMATDLTGRTGVSGPISGIFAASRSAKKTWRSAFDCVPAMSSVAISRSFLMPSAKGKVAAASSASTIFTGAIWPARPGGHGLALLGEKGGVGAAELVGALADLAALCAAGNGDGLGELDRAVEQVALHDLVDQADFLGLRGGDRIAGGDHVERRLDADDARHALRAAGAGEDAELHLGKAELRRRHRDAIVAAERDFEPAAQRGAVDRDHDRLRANLRNR